MPLALIRRLVKGSPLTAAEHDSNLDVLEAATVTDLGYNPATRLLSSSTGTDVTIPLVNTTAAGLIPHTWLTGEEAATLEHIHGNIAGEVYEHVKAGASLSALTPYRIIGGVGDTDRVEVVAADAGNSNTMPASGILPGALASNADGHGTVAGVIAGVNTAAYPPGTVLYVAVGGGLTATRPSANVQMVAVVGRQHASTGTVVPLIGPSLALSAYTGAYGDLTGLPTLGTAAAAATTDFAPAAQGVANGNSHNHDGGDGAQIAYGSLSGLPGNFTSSTAGLVPASGGGTSNFLRADGTFAAPPGGGGSPGGTGTEIQYRSDATTFGAIVGSSVDPATGNTTFSARWISSRNSAASEPAYALTGTWFTGGTTTTTKPHFLIEPAGATSTAWSVNGTGFGVNAPSGFLGNLLDLQVNGGSQFSVNRVGTVSCGALFVIGGAGVTANRLAFDNANQDTHLQRDAAHVVAQRNGTAAQAYRLYNTFTSTTNFERLNVRWTSNEAIIDTEAGSGGGTLRGLKLGSASTSLLGFYGATPVAQGAAVADATDAASVITQLNALLARVRAVGLIAT